MRKIVLRGLLVALFALLLLPAVAQADTRINVRARADWDNSKSFQSDEPYLRRAIGYKIGSTTKTANTPYTIVNRYGYILFTPKPVTGWQVTGFYLNGKWHSAAATKKFYFKRNGHYTLIVTSRPTPSTVYTKVFNDAGHNGPDGYPDSGIGGWKLSLEGTSTAGRWISKVATSSKNEETLGEVKFTYVPPGVYRARLILPATGNWKVLGEAEVTVTVSPGQVLKSGPFRVCWEDSVYWQTGNELAANVASLTLADWTKIRAWTPFEGTQPSEVATIVAIPPGDLDNNGSWDDEILHYKRSYFVANVNAIRLLTHDQDNIFFHDSWVAGKSFLQDNRYWWVSWFQDGASWDTINRDADLMTMEGTNVTYSPYIPPAPVY